MGPVAVMAADERTLPAVLCQGAVITAVLSGLLTNQRKRQLGETLGSHSIHGQPSPGT